MTIAGKSLARKNAYFRTNQRELQESDKSMGLLFFFPTKLEDFDIYSSNLKLQLFYDE